MLEDQSPQWDNKKQLSLNFVSLLIPVFVDFM